MKILSVISERQLFLANLIVNIVFHYLMSIWQSFQKKHNTNTLVLEKRKYIFTFHSEKSHLYFFWFCTITSKPYTWTMYQGLKLVEVPRTETCCILNGLVEFLKISMEKVQILRKLVFGSTYTLLLYTAMYNLNFRVLNTFNSWFRYILLLSPVKQPFYYKYCLYMSVWYPRWPPSQNLDKHRVWRKY